MAAAGYLRIATAWRDKDPANKNTQETILVLIWRGIVVHGLTARDFNSIMITKIDEIFLDFLDTYTVFIPFSVDFTLPNDKLCLKCTERSTGTQCIH